ncbi:MAG: hypothetical protein HY675_02240 [Chloroflexi bacterium]|nr:hypothetical protein [Chloroflexota bacterium]
MYSHLPYHVLDISEEKDGNGRHVRCLFCKQETTGSIEHIIPEALTGFSWLTVREVCEKCNNTLGANVDNLSSRCSLVFRLAVEARLTPWGKINVEVEDERTGEYFPGLFDYRDGTVEEITRTQKDGSRRLRFFGRTQEEVALKTEDIARKIQSRGRDVRTNGPFVLSSRAKTHCTGGDAEAQALCRFAAKATIEYVCKTAGPNVAMMPELDPLREYVLRTQPPIIARFSVIGSPRWMWLPRQSVFYVFDEQSTSSNETRRIVDEWMVNNPGLPPPGVPLAPRPIHELRVERRGTSAQCVLTLFGLAVIEVDLPGTLQLANMLDSCDLLTHKKRLKYL